MSARYINGKVILSAKRWRSEQKKIGKRGGDARRKFWIKPLKATDQGVAQAFFLPLKETILKHRQYTYFHIFFACNPKGDLHGHGLLSRLNMMAFCPEHPKWDQNPKFTPPKRDDEHPHPPGLRNNKNFIHRGLFSGLLKWQKTTWRLHL